MFISKTKTKHIQFLASFKPAGTQALWVGWLEGRTVRELKAMAHQKRLEVKGATLESQVRDAVLEARVREEAIAASVKTRT